MGLIQLPKKSEKFFKQNLSKIFSTGNFAESEWNNKLKDLVKKISNAKGCVNFCSNGAGLLSILQIWKENYGYKSILIQNNTMYGMYTMALSSGLKLEGFVNSSLDTLMPTFEDLIKALKKVKCKRSELILMLSHMGGIINPDIKKIANFCRKNKIKLLEDCAHSFGSTLKQKHSGLFGDAGVYSFYATKSIPAGEGGVLVSNNKEIIDLCERYTKYDRFEQQMKVGVNFRISEIQALLIYSAIKYYKDIIRNKSKTFKIYKKFCLQNNIRFIDQEKIGKGNHYKFIIINHEKKISKYLPYLKTKTSGIYDYSLNGDNFIPEHHVCLPIWFNQKNEVAKKVITELSESLNV